MTVVTPLVSVEELHELLSGPESGRPTLLDVRTDPSIPPIPPHATFEQAKDAAKAILKGDENARSVIMEGIKTKVQEFLPHSGN